MIKGAAKAWEAMKQVASPEERKEFEAIENKDKILEAQKKKLAAADPVRAVIIEKLNEEGATSLPIGNAIPPEFSDSTEIPFTTITPALRQF